ncbi:thiamine phosphate synthase [Sphingomonas astaxanthinifaciens]|uniref:Thiamine phosphate synthase/TenI domain-containing protein n=1 Tax=Sphingomonas astaxanthinifaciens DSM 22298 TaxID=1123267 RepID=A0ABQ5Z5H7_9SPHN|nr:thiamine phosphate synthase [Sphingomonas astaxanthinifaciens]GLR46781.1 hypothetical protein GCM10007925_04920 [Sphingomonas astaxanthinifaciens DSM 22298]
MRRQGWPTSWLLTDERMGKDLATAIARAAEAGAGIIVRHHTSGRDERRRIAQAVRESGAVLGIARDVALAAELRADLVHNPDGGTDLPFSLSVHDHGEAEAAAQRPAAMVFVSPVFSTRSHPGAKVLGEAQALALARAACHPAIALGGMDAERGATLMARGFHGWAGIDCWLRT